MTAKEYLQQAYRLDQKINSDLEEAARLREMVSSVGSPGFEERHNPNRPTEAPFARGLERVWELERKITAEIDQLVNLREQIRTVIDAVPDADERMVLTYRYLRNMTWEEIGSRLYAGASTVRRWHNAALAHIRLPEHPIILYYGANEQV